MKKKKVRNNSAFMPKYDVLVDGHIFHVEHDQFQYLLDKLAECRVSHEYRIYKNFETNVDTYSLYVSPRAILDIVFTFDLPF